MATAFGRQRVSVPLNGLRGRASAEVMFYTIEQKRELFFVSLQIIWRIDLSLGICLECGSFLTIRLTNDSVR